MFRGMPQNKKKGENNNVTQILNRWRKGDAQALDELAPLVMRDLRLLAIHHLNGPEAHGIQATELVNEFYAIVANEGRRPQQLWRSRKQFFAFAATAMRNLLLSTLRKHNAAKRGGDLTRVPLDYALNQHYQPDEVLRIGEALSDLARLDPLQAQIIDLVFFVGLTQKQAARALDMPEAQLRRQWRTARLWLREALSDD